MSHKDSSRKHLHLYLVRNQNAISSISDHELKQIAKAFCGYLQIDPYQDYLKYWLEVSKASNNLDTIIFWLSKQQSITDQLPDFKELANKFQDEVDDLTPPMYF